MPHAAEDCRCFLSLDRPIALFTFTECSSVLVVILATAVPTLKPHDCGNTHASERVLPMNSTFILLVRDILAAQLIIGR